MREADYTDVLELDLATSSRASRPEAPAGPRAPAHAKDTYRKAHGKMRGARAEEPGRDRQGLHHDDGKRFDVTDGAVLIAAITSCTNTSNPPCWSPRASWRAMRASTA